MQKIIFLLLSVAFYWAQSSPVAVPQPEPKAEPQDFQTGALMMAGEMKEMADNGAAAGNQGEIEFMGFKISNNRVTTFGDTMRFPAGRRRRREIGEQKPGADNSLSYSDWDYSSSDYSCETEEIDSKEFSGGEQRKKRDASSSASSSSSRSSSSDSSSSSSDESD